MRLFAALFLTSTLACAAADDVAVRWEGSIQIPGRECALIVDLEQAGGKDWSGSIIIPGLGVKGAPLSEIAVKDSEIGFTIKGALASERVGSAKFQGRNRAAAGADLSESKPAVDRISTKRAAIFSGNHQPTYCYVF